MVALGVHALLVSDIVAPLDGPRRPIPGVGTDRATRKQTGSGTDSCSGSRTAEGSADRTTRRRPKSSARSGSSDRAIRRRLLRRNPNLLFGVLPAQGLFTHEEIEGLAGRGHHRNTRA